MARKYKGELVDKSATVKNDLSMGEFSVPGTQIIEVEQESWFSIFLGWGKSIIAFVLLALAVIALLYTGLATTILVYSPTGDGASRNIVLRGAWSDSGGIPPIGSEVVISASDAAPTTNWWEWAPIGWAGIPNVATVEIVSTNYDKLYIEKTATADTVNVVILNNETVNGVLEPSVAFPMREQKDLESFKLNHQLSHEFLVKCVSGECTPGSYYIISDQQIFGEKR